MQQNIITIICLHWETDVLTSMDRYTFVRLTIACIESWLYLDVTSHFQIQWALKRCLCIAHCTAWQPCLFPPVVSLFFLRQKTTRVFMSTRVFGAGTSAKTKRSVRERTRRGRSRARHAAARRLTVRAGERAGSPHAPWLTKLLVLPQRNHQPHRLLHPHLQHLSLVKHTPNTQLSTEYNL